MDTETQKIIRDEIAPLVQNGRATLFLGAGFSYGTKASGGLPIPSTPELIERILTAEGYDLASNKGVDLSLAFSIGQQSTTNNFDNFLLKTFTCTKPFEWQQIPFKYWWPRVFTTNIDTVIQQSISNLRAKGTKEPAFGIFNYRDRRPAVPDYLQPPIVFLHGTIEKLQEGFVFDSVQYADYAVRGGDWLYEAALHLAHGHCVLVGSRFREPDLEVALRERALWDKTAAFNNPSWLILPIVSPIERANYLKRNIHPINATAEEFFKFLESNLTVLSSSKYLKRIAPHVRVETTQNIALAYFAISFSHVPTDLKLEAPKQGLVSRYFTGDTPTWFYLAHNVPAYFEHTENILNAINGFATQAQRTPVFCSVVTGRVGSGKTTACMQILQRLAEVYQSVYSFKGTGGIEIERTWSIIKEMKGFVALFFDKSSEHFYAINELAERVIKDTSNLKVAFLIEERELEYERNSRHLSIFPKDSVQVTHIPPLSIESAGRLVDALTSAGMTGGQIKFLDRASAAHIIVDKDRGYRGDLLATMCDVVSNQPFEKFLDAEYGEVRGEDPKTIFHLLSLVTAARLMIPIAYIAEILRLGLSNILTILNRDLVGKVFFNDDANLVSARHHVIADYHLSKFISSESKENLIVLLMGCVSRKFTVTDIRMHPLPYRIYRAVLSHDFLSLRVFPNNRERIYNVYSACQTMFPKDGIFWLQFGKFLHDEKRYEDALHCLRKGLELFESFQIRHALGQLLLDMYIADGGTRQEYYDEGVAILTSEAISRGGDDAYPYTTLGNALTKILQRRNDPAVRERLTDVINKGLKLGFQKDVAFGKMFARAVGSGFFRK